jgi:hypothetical protein
LEKFLVTTKNPWTSPNRTARDQLCASRPLNFSVLALKFSAACFLQPENFLLKGKIHSNQFRLRWNLVERSRHMSGR